MHLVINWILQLSSSISNRQTAIFPSATQRLSMEFVCSTRKCDPDLIENSCLLFASVFSPDTFSSASANSLQLSYLISN